MRRYLESITAFGIGLAWLLGDTEMSHAQDNTVTAIDIALEPDATMVQHARADNARLLKDFPAFQVVPVMALAIWDRLPKVWPFQAKPSSKIMTRSSLPFHSRTSNAPAFKPKPSRV